MESKAAKASFMVVCLILGIMIATQFKATANYQQGYSDPRLEDVITELSSATAERDALAKEVVVLRERLTTFESNDAAVEQLQAELAKVNIISGLVPVQGQGIIITINDNPNALQNGENPNNGLVHDKDLQEVVNELKASGAEAISINNERITPLTGIRCAGPTIHVNWNKVVPPYVIKAIGNPEVLDGGMLLRGGILYNLKTNYGLDVKMEKAENLEIPAYKGSLQIEYCMPIKTNEAE